MRMTTNIKLPGTFQFLRSVNTLLLQAQGSAQLQSTPSYHGIFHAALGCTTEYCWLSVMALSMTPFKTYSSVDHENLGWLAGIHATFRSIFGLKANVLLLVLELLGKTN